MARSGEAIIRDIRRYGANDVVERWCEANWVGLVNLPRRTADEYVQGLFDAVVKEYGNTTGTKIRSPVLNQRRLRGRNLSRCANKTKE